MKKFFCSLLILCTLGITTSGYETKPLPTSQLVDIYKIAFDSFISEEPLMKSTDYIAIDLSTPYFYSLSKNDRDIIIYHLKNKYSKPTINATFDTLKKLDLVSDRYETLNKHDKEGIFLSIDELNFQSDTRLVIRGFWYIGGVAAKSFRVVLAYDSDKWVLKQKKMTSIS